MAILRPTPFALNSQCNCMCTEYRHSFASPIRSYSYSLASSATDNNPHRASPSAARSKGRSKKHSDQVSDLRSRRRKALSDKLSVVDKRIAEITSDLHGSQHCKIDTRSENEDGIPEICEATRIQMSRAFASNEQQESTANENGGDSAWWAGDIGTWAPLPDDERWYELRTAAFSGAHHTYLTVRSWTLLITSYHFSQCPSHPTHLPSPILRTRGCTAPNERRRCVPLSVPVRKGAHRASASDFVMVYH